MNPKVVILCGGKGTRLEEITETVPKPLVPIGDSPIVMHIMQLYAHYGVNDVILCTGYKGEMFEDFLRRYYSKGAHIQFDLGSGVETVLHKDDKPIKVICADTGLDTPTGGRLLRVAEYLQENPYFLCTYGDGVSDVNIGNIVEFHESHHPVATLMGTNPVSRFGEIHRRPDGFATEYRQKPRLRDVYINAGFMVLDKKFLDYLSPDSPIEEPFEKLVSERNLAVFTHDGFWHCMDTRQERDRLNDLWKSGNPPWKVWK